MTKKDYIVLAKIISGLPEEQRFSIATPLIVYLMDDNPRFDHDKFLAACFPDVTFGE